MRGMGSLEEEFDDDDDNVKKTPKDFHFAIEDRRNSLVLTSKHIHENLNVKVYVSDPCFGLDDDDGGRDEVEDGKNNIFGPPRYDSPPPGHVDSINTKQSSGISFVASVSHNDVGVSLKFKCTAHPDKICLKRITKQLPPSLNQTDLDMIDNLNKTYVTYLKVRGIKPNIICYLGQLKLELNRFKRSFALNSRKPSRWNDDELFPFTVSSLYDYCSRWRFDMHTDLHNFLSLFSEGSTEDDSCNVYTLLLTKKGKDETIFVKIFKPDTEAGADKKKEKPKRRIVFGLTREGLCLNFHSTVYPDKISVDSLHVEDGVLMKYHVPYIGSCPKERPDLVRLFVCHEYNGALPYDQDDGIME